jgi:hypothetical protein
MTSKVDQYLATKAAREAAFQKAKEAAIRLRWEGSLEFCKESIAGCAQRVATASVLEPSGDLSLEDAGSLTPSEAVALAHWILDIYANHSGVFNAAT